MAIATQLEKKKKKVASDRLPHRRWELAVKLASAEGTPTRTVDASIKRAVRYLRATDSAYMTVNREIWARHRWPDIDAALAIYDSDSTDDKRKRYIESAFLARRTYEEIAEDMHISVDAVKAYELFFFDVRDIIDNKAAVCGSVLLPFMTKAEKDNMFMAIAYFFGWEAFTAYSIGESIREVEEWVLTQRNRNARLNSLIYVNNVDAANPRNAEVVMTTAMHIDVMEEKDKDRRAGAGQLGETKDSVQMLLNSAPTNIMPIKELRADEARVLPGAVEESYVEAKKPEPMEHGKVKQS